MVEAARTAAAFHGLVHASALFTAPLPRIVEADMLPARSSDVPSVPFALADDGIGIDVAELAVNAWLVVYVFAGAQGARQADDRCHMYSRGVERLRALPGRGARGDDVVHQDHVAWVGWARSDDDMPLQTPRTLGGAVHLHGFAARLRRPQQRGRIDVHATPPQRPCQ